MSAFRFTLMGTALVALSACAADPVAPERAPVEFRGVVPVAKARPAPKATQQAAISRAPAATPPAPRVVDMGTSSSPAVIEAKALAPENGARPGGALLQPNDSLSARRIEVLPGDTLYDISRRYSVNMRALIESNRLEPPYDLNPGSNIFLPPPNIHRVERGETLYSISRRYNVDTRSLALLNGLARPWSVWPGDEILLPPLARDQFRSETPIAVKAPSAKPKAATKTLSSASMSGAVVAPVAPVPVPSRAPAPKIAPGSAKGPAEFIWPVSGAVLKGYGTGDDGQRNDGVNIDVPAGTPVKAAAAGEVVYAGDELVGFGNLVLIRHAGGWVTAYAHAQSLKVKEGDMVSQGQAIASSGQTGNAGSPQVHFELRKGKEPVDPSEHLPALG